MRWPTLSVGSNVDTMLLKISVESVPRIIVAASTVHRDRGASQSGSVRSFWTDEESYIRESLRHCRADTSLLRHAIYTCSTVMRRRRGMPN